MRQLRPPLWSDISLYTGYMIRKRPIGMMLAIVAVLCFCSAAMAQQPFRRGLEQTTFIPKGQFIAGLTASFSQSNNDNYQFLIVEGISGNTYSMKVSPMLCYAVKDNLAIGGRVAYKRSRSKIDEAEIKFDSESDYSVDNLYDINHTISAMGILRQYLSLGSTRRFGLFAEMQLEFGYGQSKTTNGSGTDFTGSFKRDLSFDIGLAPGIVVFLNNYSAIEVNVGVLGFGYTHSKLTTDQIYISNLKTTSANFKINLFSISIGAAFYL